jgi:hypothetical protein
MTGAVCFVSTRIGELLGVLLMKRHALARHAFVKLELGNFIAFDGHDPSGSGVIIGVKVIEPCGWPLFVGLWERANEVHAGSDGLVYHGGISSLRLRSADHGKGKDDRRAHHSHTIQTIDKLVSWRIFVVQSWQKSPDLPSLPLIVRHLKCIKATFQGIEGRPLSGLRTISPARSRTGIPCCRLTDQSRTCPARIPSRQAASCFASGARPSNGRQPAKTDRVFSRRFGVVKAALPGRPKILLGVGCDQRRTVGIVIRLAFMCPPGTGSDRPGSRLCESQNAIVVR